VGGSLDKEGNVQDRSIWTTVAVVALAGGAITALLYTDRGRQSLVRFEQAMDEFGRSLEQLRGAVQKAAVVAAQGIDVASEGIQVVSSLMGKSGRRPESGLTH
jgi:hypothetical protein